MRVPALISILLWMLAAQPGAAMARDPSDLDVQMKFSRPSVVLGEPVWVEVSIRNASGAPLGLDIAGYCPDFGTMPLTAEVAGAQPDSGHRASCSYGRPGGSCEEASPSVLPPGGSIRHRYLLEGNFHFIRPGLYAVNLHLHLNWGPADEQSVRTHRLEGQRVLVTRSLSLAVLPANPAVLFAREQQLAWDASAVGDPDGWQNLYGISKQPVAGMEPVFRRFFERSADTTAIAGLASLNTAEARAILAEIASKPAVPDSQTESSEGQWVAAESLSSLGDRTYAPLMLKLLASPSRNVRRAAIFGVGRLAGDAGLARLAQIARHGSEGEQIDAAQAMAYSQSRRAVQLLIDRLAFAAGGQMGTDWPLFVITHHSLPRLSHPRTPRQAHLAWQAWWDANRRTARLYNEYECAKSYY